MVSSLKRSRLSALLSTLLLLAGCGGGGGGSSKFSLRNTRQGVSNETLVMVEGRWLAYLASEATSGRNGTDYNGDGDFSDSIAVVVDMRGGRQRELDVATSEIEIIGDEIYLVVAEDQDGFDWDLDGVQDDLVLLHWSRQNNALTFVASLNPNGRAHMVDAGDRLYFSESPVVPLAAPDTTLNFVTQAAPTTPMRVQSADLANTLSPGVIAEDEGLLFLFQDETVEGRDLNGDGDSLDGFVLALLDTTNPADLVRSVGLAIESDDTPVRARATAASDWLVGFLVNEAAQGDANLNDPALFAPGWQPSQCLGLADTDTFDNVLHFLHFAAWSLNPGLNPPVNSGLVGEDRVLAVRGTGGSPGYVATISAEDDEGTCSLNLDAADFDPLLEVDEDQDDRILRWIEASPAAVPPGDTKQLIALSIAGGNLSGVTDFGDRFVCLFDEFADAGRDYNDDDFDYRYVLGVMDPNVGPNVRWNFDMSAGVDRFVASNWMQEDRERGYLFLTVQENLHQEPLNFGDGDTDDSVPAFATFDPVDSVTLDLPGPPVATQFLNAGIAIAGDWLFFRTPESSDNRRWNSDRDFADTVLLRARLDKLDDVKFVTTLENNPDGLRPARFFVGGDIGVAYIANEVRDRRDYNQDGDRLDFVIRWFRI